MYTIKKSRSQKQLTFNRWKRGSLMRRLSQTVKVFLALVVGVFSNGLLTSAVATAAPQQGDQPVWCQFTDHVWTAQQGGSNPNRFALTQLPPNSPASMYIDDATGQVWTNNSSYDQMKGALDTQCQIQYGSVTAVAPNVTPVCGPNNDIVTLASTTNVS